MTVSPGSVVSSVAVSIDRCACAPGAALLDWTVNAESGNRVPQATSRSANNSAVAAFVFAAQLRVVWGLMLSL